MPYVIRLFLFGCILTSCIKDEVAVAVDTADRAADLFRSSKAAGVVPSYWSVGDEIGISAYNPKIGKAYPGFAHKRYRTADGYTFTPYSDEDCIFYPSNGGAVDFVAYFPYRSGITNNMYEIDVTDQMSLKDIDFMYSDNAKGKNKHSMVADLAFNHRLTKIVIEISPGTGLTEEELHGMHISLDGFFRHAAFDLSADILHISGDRGAIVMNTDGISSEAIVLPGASPDAQIVITTAEGNVYTTPLPEFDFRPGTLYRYRVSINRTEITIDTVHITDWLGTQDPQGVGPSVGTAYDVGDYFPNPSDPATAIGVVYWLFPGSNGRAGKILSFDTSQKAWSTNNTDEIRAVSIVSGWVNMNAALTVDPTLAVFPAFGWCVGLGEGWYLPSRYELHVLREEWGRHAASIDAALTAAGGEPLSESDVYLSSSECRDFAESMAESYTFSTKGWSSDDKTTPLRVRAVKAF